MAFGYTTSQHIALYTWVGWYRPYTIFRSFSAASGLCLEFTGKGYEVHPCNHRIRAQHWYFVESRIQAPRDDAHKLRLYQAARQSHPACDLGLESCFTKLHPMNDVGIFPVPALVSPPDDIERQIEQLDVERLRQQKNLTYDYYQFSHFPVEECSEERKQAWHSSHEGKITEAYLAEKIRINKESNFAETARNAIHATIKAFQLAKMPLILAHGSDLGWYRQCDVIAHTTDVDFIVPGDYFVSDEHVRLLNKALAYYGVYGMFRVYGGEFTKDSAHVTHIYQDTKNGTHVFVDFFVTMPSGLYFTSTSWSSTQAFTCRFPNSGFRYIDFIGSSILAPIDQNAYLTADYGPDYMKPAKTDVYGSCFYTFETLKSKLPKLSDLVLKGGINGWRGYFDSYTVDVKPTYPKSDQLMQMFNYVNLISQAFQLQFVVACISARYALGQLTVPPSYAAIAIRADDETKWLQELAKASLTTTFFLDSAGDGSVLHLRFSRYSTTRLVVWRLPAAIRALETAPFKYPEVAVPVNVVPAGVDYHDDIINLCKSCAQCPKHREFVLSGTLSSQARPHMCMDTPATGTIALYACHYGVCD